MTYRAILVDVFNLYYRRLSSCLEKDPISIANSLISFIETDISSHLNKKDGELYLLYDPIPKSDLGMSKSFKTTRQNIDKNYKANRVHDKKCVAVVDLIRRYFLHRGDKIYTVISDKYEADDFVESIIKDLTAKIDLENPDGNVTSNIALFTNDEDWCRSITC